MQLLKKLMVQLRTFHEENSRPGVSLIYSTSSLGNSINSTQTIPKTKDQRTYWETSINLIPNHRYYEKRVLQTIVPHEQAGKVVPSLLFTFFRSANRIIKGVHIDAKSHSYTTNRVYLEPNCKWICCHGCQTMCSKTP